MYAELPQRGLELARRILLLLFDELHNCGVTRISRGISYWRNRRAEMLVTQEEGLAQD